MVEAIKFYFDPRSPWCYQASRWARRLEALGEIELDWGVFSLEVVALKPPGDPRSLDAVYGPVHRSSMVIRERFGSKAIGRFYGALGRLMWESPDPPSMPVEVTTREALAQSDFDPGIVDEAMGDSKWWEAVLDEHTTLVETKGAFGVPTIVLDGGDGPAIFGPTIRSLPDDESSLELWRSVRFLTGFRDFYELKRNKPFDERGPSSAAAYVDLPAAAWRKQEQYERQAAVAHG